MSLAFARPRSQPTEEGAERLHLTLLSLVEESVALGNMAFNLFPAVRLGKRKQKLQSSKQKIGVGA